LHQLEAHSSFLEVDELAAQIEAAAVKLRYGFGK
jgi:hypothetical protein